MKITLITATYNRSKEIKYLLESLNNQTSKDFELIIVDQNKDDRMINFLENFNYNFILRYFKINEIGLSKARNYGIREANYDIVGFPDDDCVYSNNLIEKLLDFFINNINIDGVLAKNIHKVDKHNNEYLITKKSIENFNIRFDSIQIFLKLNLLKEIGFFDEKLGLPNWFASGEETDILIKLMMKDKIIYYSPFLNVYHPASVNNLKNINFDNIRKRSRGTGALWKKHNFKKLVIIRGLVSPVFRILLYFYNFYRVRYYWNVFIGRIEGYRYWN